VPMNLAQETPAQNWIVAWVNFLSDILPAIFIVSVLLVGITLIFKAQGAFLKVIMFGVAAGLMFLFLTNVEAVSNFFRNELPLESFSDNIPGPDIPSAPDSTSPPAGE
jgi:hypothetical protein